MGGKTTTAFLVAGFVVLFGAGSGQGADSLFVSLPDVVDVEACVAEPGGGAPSFSGSAIVGWSTQPQAKKASGVYTIRFKEPTVVGTVAVYSKCSLSYESGGKWASIAYAGPAAHRLRFVPLPANVKVTALRATVQSSLVTGGADLGLYATSLGFLAILSGDYANVAPGAAVVVSSSSEASQGFEPLAWLNKSWTLVDGFVDGGQNFFSRPREEDEPITAELPEWVTLVWEKQQDLDGLVIARGSSEKGLGDAVIEAYTGDGDPRFALGNAGWRVVEGRFSEPMKFRSMQAVGFGRTTRTKAIRLKCIGGVDRLGLGEVIAGPERRPRADILPEHRRAESHSAGDPRPRQGYDSGP